MEKQLKIQIAGPSGIGKTTIAKSISKELGIPFVSGSYSDLIPNTKGMTHSEMISLSPGEIYKNDFQLLNLRKRLFEENDLYVSDRSFIDSAAYFINKLSGKLPDCETENYLEICKTLLVSNHVCTNLIFLPYTIQHFSKWEIEDNHKRITNRYFQFQISLVMYGMLSFFGYSRNYLMSHFIDNMEPIDSGLIEYNGNKLKVLILTDIDHDIRMGRIMKFLDL